MASTVTLTFNNQPSVDEVISFTDSLTGTAISFTFKTARTATGEVKIGTNVYGTAQNLYNAFQIDYNNTSLYSTLMEILPNLVLTITANNAASQFTLNSNTADPDIEDDINNVSDPGTFTIDTVVVSEAGTDPCDNVKFTVTTSEQSDSISSPIEQSVGSNPFVFEVARSENIKLIFNKGSDSASVKYRVPLLLSANIEVDVVNSPSGAAVTIIRSYPLSNIGDVNLVFPMTFTYSLDGTNYQSSNSWSGIEAGDYTAYIKDNLGCETTVDFTVDEFTANLVDYEDVFEVSNINPIRYKKVETWANCGTQKTVENTLSHEENTPINNRNFVQWWQTCDTDIVTQVKTNYDTVTAKLIDCDGAETSLTVTKKTNNMDITDVRDGTITVNNSNQIGVYFGSGTTYDSTTLASNGTYNIGQSLMDWINEGDYINIVGIGWVQVTSIASPTTDIPFYVAYTSATNDGFFTEPYPTLKITTVYNVANFERYEFSMDCTLLDGFYQIQIDGTDATATAVQFLSEWQHIKTAHNQHYVLEYYNTENNEINYATGVTFKLRLPYHVALKWKPNEEQDIYITDTQTIPLNNRVRKLYEMTLKPLPTAMAQKVVLALSQDRVFINGVNYVKEGETDITPIGATNTYLVKATLVQGNYVFDSTTATVETLNSGTALAIDANTPGLLFVD